MRDPEVVFAAYKIPHPLEYVMLVSVQTTPNSSPVRAFRTALRSLLREFDTLKESFMVCPSRANARGSVFARFVPVTICARVCLASNNNRSSSRACRTSDVRRSRGAALIRWRRVGHPGEVGEEEENDDDDDQDEDDNEDEKKDDDGESENRGSSNASSSGSPSSFSAPASPSPSPSSCGGGNEKALSWLLSSSLCSPISSAPPSMLLRRCCCFCCCCSVFVSANDHRGHGTLLRVVSGTPAVTW